MATLLVLAKSTWGPCRTGGVLRRLGPTLESIIESGVARATSERRRFQTRASNIVALAFTLLSLPYLVLEYAVGAHLMAAITAFSCLVYAATIPLNRLGLSKLARALPLIGGTTAAWFACLILTPASQVQLVLFMVGLWRITFDFEASLADAPREDTAVFEFCID